MEQRAPGSGPFPGPRSVSGRLIYHSATRSAATCHACTRAYCTKAQRNVCARDETFFRSPIFQFATRVIFADIYRLPLIASIDRNDRFLLLLSDEVVRNTAQIGSVRISLSGSSERDEEISNRGK